MYLFLAAEPDEGNPIQSCESGEPGEEPGEEAVTERHSRQKYRSHHWTTGGPDRVQDWLWPAGDL